MVRYFYFCIWLKLGDIPTLHLILHWQCLFLLPEFCVPNSVAPNMDELTHNVSEWGGVSVPTTHRSQCSHGASRMEWTWRTATELNMPNSPRSLNSVQEVFHEVSEPNPMGNAVLCCYRSSHSCCSHSASCGQYVLSKFQHQQALSHQACFFGTVTSF